MYLFVRWFVRSFKLDQDLRLGLGVRLGQLSVQSRSILLPMFDVLWTGTGRATFQKMSDRAETPVESSLGPPDHVAGGLDVGCGVRVPDLEVQSWQLLDSLLLGPVG